MQTRFEQLKCFESYEIRNIDITRNWGPRHDQAVNSPVTMSVFDQGISGAMMTSIAVSPSMAKMTATASVESD